MRVIILFDLPIDTSEERREYTRFRKHLIKNGFLLMQESVYVKLVPNSVAAAAIVDDIKKHKPSNGLVQALRITERQFASIENIVGKKESEVIDSDERLVIL